MLLNPYRFGGGTKYRYFRLTTTKWVSANATGKSGLVRIAELEIYNVTDVKFPSSVMTGASSPSPLVATASSTLAGGFEPYRAFDGNLSDSNRYISDALTGVDQWLQIDLGASAAGWVAPAYFKIAADAAVTSPSSNYMVDFKIDGSATGAFAGEESRILTRVGLTSSDWSPSTLRRFDAP